jgi:RHS repeat-associated protein
MTLRQGDSIGWYTFHYPVNIYTGSSSTAEEMQFSYGPDRQKWQQTYAGPTTSETINYVGGLMEVVTNGAATDYRHYIYGIGNAVAVYSRKSSGVNALSYLMTDHQDSVAGITNSVGGVVVNENYTPFGVRRNPTTWSGSASNADLMTAAGIVQQGYTFQTQLGLWSGLNHMNGRVQDATIGRFLSPDPRIPDPTSGQSYNRYSYVNNNPLSYVDPSGFDGCGVSDTEVVVCGPTGGTEGPGLDGVTGLGPGPGPGAEPGSKWDTGNPPKVRPPEAPCSGPSCDVSVHGARPSGLTNWPQVNQGQLGNQDQLEEVTVTGSRSILDRLTNWLCEEGQEDLIKGAADSTANLGAASDIVRPAAAIVAGAAVSSRSLPSPQATSFLGSQAANALETVGILGKRVAQISILGDVANGNYQSALFDTADYFVYKGLGEAAAAGALETGGASVATAGLAALTYYNAGGAQGLIQGSLCGD